MGEVDGVFAVLDADVDVLAENRELLGEIAVERRDALEALRGKDAPLGPAVERVRSRRRDGDVENVGGATIACARA
jgi:hypothetical protein